MLLFSFPLRVARKGTGGGDRLLLWVFFGDRRAQKACAAWLRPIRSEFTNFLGGFGSIKRRRVGSVSLLQKAILD